MVSKKDIEGCSFETIEGYFEYIVESIVNGQRTQAKNLIGKMSKAQKKEAITHLDGFGSMESITEAKDKIMDSF